MCALLIQTKNIKNKTYVYNYSYISNKTVNYIT